MANKIDNIKISPLPTGNYLAGGDDDKILMDTAKVVHDKYEVRNLDFCTVLPDHMRADLSKPDQQNFLLREAANKLAEQIMAMDGVFTINTRYVIDTKETRVYHRIKVLVTDK